MVLDMPDSAPLAFPGAIELGGFGLYDAFKVLHVLAAVIWVGGAFTLQVLLFKATRAADLDRSAARGQDAEYVGQRVFFPASIAILFFGIWMVLDQPVWAFGQLQISPL
jgi:uncharacterized membrane protein